MSQIAALYGQLAMHAPSPVVEPNRAVAVAMADAYRVALALDPPEVDARDLRRRLAEVTPGTGA